MCICIFIYIYLNEASKIGTLEFRSNVTCFKVKLGHALKYIAPSEG
jgi:hypothetical protein